MQKIVLTFGLFLTSALISAQTTQVFWAEDFNNNCSSNCLAGTYTGPNGSWSVTDVNTPGNVANEWFISCAENGEPIGSCGAGCGNNATLHIGNVPCNLCLVCPNGDCGAAYNAGPAFGGENPTTDKRAVSPVISTIGYSNIILAFKYIERGQNTNDNATVDYSTDGGITWIQLVNTAKTATTCGSGQGLWTAFTDTLPSSCNNLQSLLLGFRWKNNSDGIGSDPSVAIDDITLAVEITGNQELSPSNLVLINYNEGTNNIYIAFENNSKPLKVALLDAAGRFIINKPLGFNQRGLSLSTSQLAKGVYTLEVILQNGRINKKLLIK